MSNANWYAVYTRPRWEKKVADTLERMQYEVYCPINKVSRTWGTRKVTVEEPLFRPYVFVRVTEKQKWEILEIPGLLNYVCWLGRPAVIRPEEIESIRGFVAKYTNICVEPLAVKPADRVRVVGGALHNQSGRVQEVRGNQVRIVIDSLGLQMMATVAATKLEKVF